MNILCIGDVTGPIGCEYVRRVLPSLKRKYKIDMVIANGENSANHNGITKSSAQHLFTSGVDVITTGNHAFKQKNSMDYFDECEYLIRPANYPNTSPGRGVCIVDKGYLQVCVINVLGTVFLEQLQSPFECTEKILEEYKDYKVKIIDFHAEATAEKQAFAYYFDGKVSGIFGTHTHVQTADEHIMKGGTAYITDIGMTGPMKSVIGIVPELSIKLIKDNILVPFEFADGECSLQGIIMNINNNTGFCDEIIRIIWKI
jgi:metallophosphoesterase, MG_246/BB_0505 family